MFGNLFGDPDEDEEDSVPASSSRSAKYAKGSAPRFEKQRQASGFVGLRNQGATCYMNSLLQAHFMTPEFRRKIFSLDPKTLGVGTTDKKKRRIPIALQRLFTQMSLVDRESISTEAFTSEAFGWTDAEVTRQQDVHELNRYLLQWLESQLKGIEGAKIVGQTFRGREVAEIEVDGKIVSTRPQDFLDLTIPVRGQRDLVSGVAKLYEPSILDGDNKYEYRGEKVDAIRFARPQNLPPILTLSLLRYYYDPQSWDRVRVNSRFPFPLVLDMRPFTRTRKRDDGGNSGVPRWDVVLKAHRAREREARESVIWLEDVLKSKENESEMYGRSRKMGSHRYVYDLFAVVTQSGGVRSGHYRALIRDVEGFGQWTAPGSAQDNDIKTKEKKTRKHSETDAELARRLQREEDSAASVGTTTASKAATKDDGWVTVARSTSNVKRNASSRSASNGRSKRGGNKSRQNSASKGRERANDKNRSRKEVQRPGAETLAKHWGCWFEFNDSVVSPASLPMIRSHFGGKDSAYMLVYRSRELASRATKGGSNRKRGASIANISPPSVWTDLIDVENRTLREERRRYEDHVNAVVVVARSASYFAVDAAGGGALLIPASKRKKESVAARTSVSSSTKTDTSAEWTTVGEAKGSGSTTQSPKRDRKVKIATASTVSERSDDSTNKFEAVLRFDSRKSVREMLELVHAELASIGDSALPSPANTRYHVLNLTEGGGDDGEFFSVGKALFSDNAVSVRDACVDDPSNVLEIIAWNGVSIGGRSVKIGCSQDKIVRIRIVRVYESESKDSDTFDVVVPASATLRALRIAVHERMCELGLEDPVPVDKQDMHLVNIGDGAAEKTPSSLRHLAENYYKRDKPLVTWGVVSGCEIYVQDARTFKGTSSNSRAGTKRVKSVLREFESRKRMIVLTVRDVRSDHGKTVDVNVDRSATFAELKRRVLVRGSDSKDDSRARLRFADSFSLVQDEGKTLHACEIRSATTFLLEVGQPLTPSQLAIRTATVDALGKRSAEAEIVVERSMTLLALKRRILCVSHCDGDDAADTLMEKRRLRKTNYMGDSAGLVVNESLRCDAALEHNALILVEHGAPPREGIVSVRLRLWYPAAAVTEEVSARMSKTGNDAMCATKESKEDVDAASVAATRRSASTLELGTLKLTKTSTLEALKRGVIETYPQVRSKALDDAPSSSKSDEDVWKRVRLRLMGPSNYPGLVLRGDDRSLDDFKFFRSKDTSRTTIVVEVLDVPESLTPNMSLVLWVQSRNARTQTNEPAWPPEQLVIRGEASKRTFKALQSALEQKFGIPPEQQRVAKFNVKRQHWNVLKPPSMSSKSNRGRKKKLRTRLDQSPYSLRDGTLVVVLDIMTDPDDADDFLRPEDRCRVAKLRKQRQDHNGMAASGSMTTQKRDKQRSRSAEDGVRLNYNCEF